VLLTAEITPPTSVLLTAEILPGCFHIVPVLVVLFQRSPGVEGVRD
jgi:hypothetical protein